MVTKKIIGRENKGNRMAHCDVPDEELLARFFDLNDRGAFEVLVIRHQKFAFRLALYTCHQTAMAEEAAQDAFLQLLQKGRKFTSQGKGSFKRWFAILVINSTRSQVLSEQRSAHRAQRGAYRERQEILQWERKLNKKSESETRETYSALHKALMSLREELRGPLTLFFLEGMPQAEMANVFGVSTRQIQKRIAKGLDILRKRLSERGISITSVGVSALLEEAQPIPMPETLATSLQEVASESMSITARNPMGSLGTWSSGVVVSVLAVAGLVGVGSMVLIQNFQKRDDDAKKIVAIKSSDTNENPKALKEIRRDLSLLLHYDFNELNKLPFKANSKIFQHLSSKGRMDSGALQAVSVDSSFSVTLPKITLPAMITFYATSETPGYNVSVFRTGYSKCVRITRLTRENKVEKHKWYRHHVLLTHDSAVRWFKGKICALAFYEFKKEKNEGWSVNVSPGKTVIIDDLEVRRVHQSDLPDLTRYRKAVDKVPTSARKNGKRIPLPDIRIGPKYQPAIVTFNYE